MYDELMNEYQDKVVIKEEEMPAKLPGLFLQNTIFIDRKKTNAEKSCILIEELMHWKYTAGDIINQTEAANIKQENFARRRGYETLIPLEKIISCFYEGYHEYFEVADYLGITEEFLRKTIAYYREKYGLMYEYQCYYINFNKTIDIYRKLP
ncbi:ImmA/IrrE family metallo-endopeptidase [Listeria sp. PSOL-1]|uniref:ImmA/IrrE family metallo-endopeptidase n=1 Tax=Listeria sp. PSOL-1 TaxID=1844999 RepID=UPI0013CF6C49